jgi:hypothetical protein
VRKIAAVRTHRVLPDNDSQEKTDFGNKPASPFVYGMRQSLIGGARLALPSGNPMRRRLVRAPRSKARRHGMWSAVLAIGLVLPVLVGVAMLKARLFSADGGTAYDQGGASPRCLPLQREGPQSQL